MAHWGRGGKYHNVGLTDPGRLQATKKQLARLRQLDRRSYETKGLTRDQAADLIEQAYARHAAERASLTPMEERFIEALWLKATKAANDAGEAWLKAHSEVQFVVLDQEAGEPIGVHGTIGNAWLSWPPRRTLFYKWLIENHYHDNKKVIDLPYRYEERFELDLKVTCLMAAYEIFRSGTNLGEIKLMTQSDTEPSVTQAA